jgi:hypothetical protein
MDKFTAAASIRTLAVQYQSMVEAADALESIGKLEQITKEQTTQADMARAEQDIATLNQTALAKQSEVEALEARLAKVQAAIAKYVG